MGDRGAIVVTEGEHICVLYTHSRGYMIERLAIKGLRRAIKAGRDHTDPDYLRRILFDSLAEGQERTGTIGYGIGHHIPDDLQHPELLIEVMEDRLLVDGQPVYEWLEARSER